MLLGGDGYRVRPLKQPPAGGTKRIPPGPRMAFRPVRMRCGTFIKDDPVFRSAEQHFRGLSGGVDTGNQGHTVTLAHVGTLFHPQ